MKAYVELIQRREREIGCDVLTHQKVSSALTPVKVVVCADLPVVRRRLCRLDDDDRYRWNVSTMTETLPPRTTSCLNQARCRMFGGC